MNRLQNKRPASAADQVALRFWGVRGSIPVPGPATLRYGGNTSCVEVRCGSDLLILDAGTGIRALGAHLVNGRSRRPLNLTLLLTHAHWDHIQGFPFFQPTYDASNRIRVVGAKDAKLGFTSILKSQMRRPFFPIRLHDLPSHLRIQELPAKPFSLGAVTVQAIRVNHPGHCVGYLLHTPHGSIGYFPDNELAKRLPSSSPTHLRDQDLARFIHGCDVLVMDAQYERGEYAHRQGWGHGCLDDVVQLAASARVKHLYLFHHDPTHSDAQIDAMVAHARRWLKSKRFPMRVSAAKEGDTVLLPERRRSGIS